MKRLALSALLVTSLVPAAHAQYGMESMMNPMTMMNPGMMMNPMTMMMPMTMMGAPMMMGGMGNPMTMMVPMTMMGAPMMGSMMNPSTMMMPMTMMGGMGGMGGPQQYMANPYLNPMGMGNPYLMQQQPQSFFPMMPAAPATSYGASAYGYYPAAPQQAPAAVPFDPAQWMQMFSTPPQPSAPTPQQ